MFSNMKTYEWDEEKNQLNFKKHKISFKEAQSAFDDPFRIIRQDLEHSGNENRFFCFGKTEKGIITVRFTYRGSTIRIYGAGLWRKGKKEYEKKAK